MGDENCEEVHLTRAISFSEHDVTSKRPPNVEVNLADIRTRLTAQDSAEKLGFTEGKANELMRSYFILL